MKKKTDQKKQSYRRQRHEPHSPKQRALAGIKISQPAAGGTAVHGAAKASGLPLALVARTPNRASVTAAKGIEEATPTASAQAPHINAASTGLVSLIDSVVEQLSQVFMLRVFHVGTIC